MKIVHWVQKNNSGMHHVAQDICRREVAEGIDSICLDGEAQEEISRGLDRDIHVVHTHLPDEVDYKAKKIVFVNHGAPEMVFMRSMIEGEKKYHGVADVFMGMMHLLQISDVMVTFWKRHQWVLKSLCEKNKQVIYVPMGVDKEEWKPVPSRGKFAGFPSLLTGENCHYNKWPLDLFIAFSEVAKEIRSARLHCICLPMDQARWWFPLVFSNGVAYRSYISPITYAANDLRNAFASVDFYIGLVNYGDHNRIGLEAKACGRPVISYRGNPYADYWVDQGDQRTIAQQLIMILRGQVPAMECESVPDIGETVSEMIKIYENL